MASKRRGGFRPPELRGTLGTLIRTTTGVVRNALERGAREGRARLDDALERGAREGRARLDGARAGRRRNDALADLGELVLDLIRRGEIDLAELPEARDLVRELDDLDDAAGAGREGDDDDEPEPPRIASRRRFDDRGPPPRRPVASSTSEHDDGTVSSGAALHPARLAAEDARSRPNNSPSSRAPTRPMKGMSRPMIDDAPPMPDRRTRVERWDATQTGPMPADRRTNVERWDAAQTAPISRVERPGSGERGSSSDRSRGERHRADARDERPDGDGRDRQRPRPDVRGNRDERARTERPDREVDRADRAPAAADRTSETIDHPPAASAATDRADRSTDRGRPLPHDPTRKGGITFDDEDLADYMHPDDVPPRPPAKDPDDHDA